MSKSIYVVGKCDYCETKDVVLRPSPFMGACDMMCKECWDDTEEEYGKCEGTYIGKFEDGPGYEEMEPLQILKEKKEKDFKLLIDALRAEFDAGVLDATIETLTKGEIKDVNELATYLEQDLSYAADCCE